jgi:predicted ribosome quality control (RQC) complex YloA/Tae2 family protein
MRVPFDSLCLAAVAAELRPLIGARAQKWVQTGAWTVYVQLYARGEYWLLLSCDPELARVHLCARRPAMEGEPPPFLAALRRCLRDARLTEVRQRGFDRILELGFATREGPHWLIAELMGKHANLMLLDPERKVQGAAKWIGPSKSRRPIAPGRPYLPPPTPERPSLLSAKLGDDLPAHEGAGPFLLRLVEALGPDGLGQVQRSVQEGKFGAFASPGHGAYPLDLAPIGLPSLPRDSFSLALEAHFEELRTARELARRRSSLRAQLDRVLLAREVALAELAHAADAASSAAGWQREAELILAYQGQIRPGDATLEAHDHDGQPVSIVLQRDLTPLQNAQRLFEKARRAKSRAGALRDQAGRLTEDRDALLGAIARLDAAQNLQDLDFAADLAGRRRWLHQQPAPARSREERPWEGRAIRELQAPGGWRVLYGENAEANDYLLTRVGRPNDLWLHVRGAASAHVLIQTHNQPERVQPETLMFAARVAVRHSPSKHSAYVPVDYTLRKHVRKPKGAAPGTATYSQEKTLHVEPG